jgi:hypothetical protein
MGYKIRLDENINILIDYEQVQFIIRDELGSENRGDKEEWLRFDLAFTYMPPVTCRSDTFHLRSQLGHDLVQRSVKQRCEYVFSILGAVNIR